MNFVTGKGFIVDKSRINDKKLIIRCLTENNSLISAIYFINKNSKKGLNHLDFVEFSFSNKEGFEFYAVKELQVLSSFVPFEGRIHKSEFYFFIAEIMRAICRKIEGEEGLFRLLNDFYYLFKHDLHADILVYFLLQLLDVFGILPSTIEQTKYFDFRDGVFCDFTPIHQDYSSAVLILKSLNLLNEISSISTFVNSKERLESLRYLLRYFEVQKGINLSLNSIEILKDLR